MVVDAAATPMLVSNSGPARTGPLASLAGQPLHKEEESGTAPLFCWNAINIRKLAFSYAPFMLCGDMLTTARSALCACVPGQARL